MWLRCFGFCIYFSIVTCDSIKNGNVVFLIADDMGWNDVSFHGSDQIPTPNIDALANSGVALHRYYSHSVCTPSRSAIMTGKFAHKIGMQGYPCTMGEKRGLPLSEKIMPEYFKELGYATHLVGKWHLGHYKKEYFPTNRGYDTFFGNLGGYIDYHEYTVEEKWSIGKVSGLDLYRNTTPDWSTEGYITDLHKDEAITIIRSHDVKRPLLLSVSFNAPHAANDGSILQAPHRQIRSLRHIESPERKTYAAMVKKLDRSIGEIIESLHTKGILNKTIIVFVSDNGGPTIDISKNWSSNLPLRGQKLTAFEGAIRVIGTIWTPKLKTGGHVWEGYMHAADWLPTLLGAVGVEHPNNIDGINHWDHILNNNISKRREIYEINEDLSAIAIIKDKFKLVISNGTSKPWYLDYYGVDLQGMISKAPAYLDNMKKSKVYKVFKDNGYAKFDNILPRDKFKIRCNHTEKERCDPSENKWCLYNIINDPCEQNDLSLENPDIAMALSIKLNEELAQSIPRVKLYRDPRANPNKFNYTWTAWLDEIK